MFIVCYLAQDDRYTSALQERFTLSKGGKAVLPARSVPDMISQLQSLPIKAVIADISWPRNVWKQITSAMQSSQQKLPIFALAPGRTEHEWWKFADGLLRLDENPELFMFHIDRFTGASDNLSERAPESVDQTYAAYPSNNTLSLLTNSSTGLLENSQFRQFAGVFAAHDEDSMIDSFVAWVQQACLTSRVVLLLRNPETGVFECKAQRGLSSSLVPHCSFPATSPICLWLMTTGHILVKNQSAGPVPREVLDGLDLMQSVVAVPTMSDGQLIGILGVGPRLVGQGYSVTELEGLFTFGAQIAMTLQHFRMNQLIHAHKEMTEHMLRIIPTGIVVLGANNRIMFINSAAAKMMGTEPLALHGMDLRAMPSPLGDIAYEGLIHHQDIPRQELEIGSNNLPVAITCSALDTTPPSSMLLIEDLTASKQLVEEHGRRVDLEVITNLVHYLAHELRNPLVALSTFNSLVTTRAGEEDFKEFCESVLLTEIDRINLLLEQLLVLTNHAEFQYSMVDLIPLFDRLTEPYEMRSSIVTAIPVSLPPVHGDAHRLETALVCILRTAIRLAHLQTPVTMQVSENDNTVVIQVEVTVSQDVEPEWFMNPWQQLVGNPEHQVDFGLATAKYIIEQHHGTLSITTTEKALDIFCRLPIGDAAEDNEGKRYVKPRTSAHRR